MAEAGLKAGSSSPGIYIDRRVFDQRFDRHPGKLMEQGHVRQCPLLATRSADGSAPCVLVLTFS
ncbi:hypothetical protein [Mesorhizobium sanjuanii]|uniref:hypothetical protein n=1 Tax=Mesorhizobium sanjuanii TaxID=2037900 RepID=UPI001AD84C53|nr:hypothetical protein [Mesorhizobium sanjuanii]